MNLRRVVQVRGRDGTGSDAFGTGYLIGPGLVLTAGHVLETEDGRRRVPSVRFPAETADQGPWRARVLWLRHDDVVDAALLRVDGPVAERAAGTAPQRWGDLVTGVARHRVVSCGYPRSQRAERAGERPLRSEEHLAGHISPGTGASARRWEVLSRDPLPAVDPHAAAWSGMSGACVFGGKLLLGVIRKDRRAASGSRLTATRAAEILADRDFRTALRAATGRRTPVAEPAELAPLLDPATRAHELRSPAMLLRADVEAIAFRGRARIWEDLWDWCTGPAGPLARTAAPAGNLALRVLTGLGGQGKSRLARRLVEVVGRRPGWVAGLFHGELADGEWTADENAALHALGDCARDLLLVVDYAETRPRSIRHLIDRAREAAASGQTVRVLLVARSSGGWQHDAYGSGAATHDLLAEAPVTELGPLDATSDDRRETFAAALRGLAGHLQRTEGYEHHDWSAVAAGLSAPADMSGSRYATALNVQMEALVTLLQAGPSPQAADDGEAVEKTLLRHEERYWDRTLATAVDRPPAMPLVRRVVAAATLCGAADEGEAMAVVARVPALAAGREWELATAIRTLYPGVGETYWGALQPDRVAEFQASSLVVETAGLLPALLKGATPAQQTQALTVLTRSVVAHANAGRTGERDKVLGQLDALLAAGPLPTEVLRAAVAALPEASDALIRFGARLTRLLVERYRESGAGETDPEGLAWALGEWAKRAARAGDWRTAVEAGEAAVGVRRARPDQRRALAGAVIHLAAYQWNADRRSVSLTLAEEAVTLCREGERTGAEPDPELLAEALNSLAVSYEEAVRLDEAVAAAEESVAIRAELAARDPAGAAAHAVSLRSLASCRSEAGDTEEGVRLMEEALRIERRLAAQNPDAHHDTLSDTLNSLSWAYWRARGDPDRIRAVSEEAVALRRRLAADNPDRYKARLALSLVNMSTEQPYDQALETLTEARGLYDALAGSPPLVRSERLRLPLSNRAWILGELQRADEAVATIEEALVHSRRLYRDNRVANGTDLANDLSKAARLHRKAGDEDTALARTEEEIEVWRTLARLRTGPHDDRLAETLHDYASALVRVERNEEALAAGDEALELYERRLREHPHRREEASACARGNSLVAWLRGTTGVGDPVPFRERAVELLRPVAGDHVSDRTLLAEELVRLAEHAAGPGSMRALLRALPLAGEATGHYASLCARRPSPSAELTSTAASWARLLERCGRRGEALEVRRRYGLSPH
ncbi:trypsin-like peptidase domain-containing protein [Streptomyces sp. NPDC001478]